VRSTSVKLSNLISLNLEDNNLSGKIPKEIGKLINLGYLNLRKNKLSREILKELEEINCYVDF
jgi:hypothetical protein